MKVAVIKFILFAVLTFLSIFSAEEEEDFYREREVTTAKVALAVAQMALLELAEWLLAEGTEAVQMAVPKEGRMVVAQEEDHLEVALKEDQMVVVQEGGQVEDNYPKLPMVQEVM